MPFVTSCSGAWTGWRNASIQNHRAGWIKRLSFFTTDTWTISALPMSPTAPASIRFIWHAAFAVTFAVVQANSHVSVDCSDEQTPGVGRGRPRFCEVESMINFGFVYLLSLLPMTFASTAIAAVDAGVIDPAAVGLSAQRLTQMEQSIRAGDFKQVTSVLIFRGGKLAFERYFDEAGKEGLRNTRSATKSVTGMLIGIAIDRRLLSGTNAQILDFSP